MVSSLDSLNGEEHVVCEIGDALWLRHARLAPDFRRVAAIAEAPQALRQALLLGRKCRQRERRGMLDEVNRRFAVILDGALHITVRAAAKVACSGAAHAPDKSAILRVELLDALIGFDHLRTANAYPPVPGNDDSAAAGGDDAAATKGTRPTADQGKHRDAG